MISENHAGHHAGLTRCASLGLSAALCVVVVVIAVNVLGERLLEREAVR